MISRVADFLFSLQAALRGPVEVQPSVHLPQKFGSTSRAALSFGLAVVSSLATLAQPSMAAMQAEPIGGSSASAAHIQISPFGEDDAQSTLRLHTWRVTLDGEHLSVIDLNHRHDLLGLSLARAGVPDTPVWRSVFHLAINHVTAWDVNRLVQCSARSAGHSSSFPREQVQEGLDRLVGRYADILRGKVDQAPYEQPGHDAWSRMERALWSQAQAWRLSGAYASGLTTPSLPHFDDACRLSEGVTARTDQPLHSSAEHSLSHQQVGDALWQWMKEVTRARPFGLLPQVVQQTLAARFEHAGLLEDPEFVSGVIHVGAWAGEWVVFPESDRDPEAWFTPAGAFALIGQSFIKEQILRWRDDADIETSSSAQMGAASGRVMPDARLQDVLRFVLEHEVGHLKMDEGVLASMGDRAGQPEYEREAVEAVERHADLWAIGRLRDGGWSEKRIESAFVMARQVLADEHFRGFERKGWQPCLVEMVAYQEAILGVRQQFENP